MTSVAPVVMLQSPREAVLIDAVSYYVFSLFVFFSCVTLLLNWSSVRNSNLTIATVVISIDVLAMWVLYVQLYFDLLSSQGCLLRIPMAMCAGAMPCAATTTVRSISSLDERTNERMNEMTSQLSQEHLLYFSKHRLLLGRKLPM